MMRNRLPIDARTVVALVGATLYSVAVAQTKWDLPTAYPPNNFHTEDIAQFVADIDKVTNGKLKIAIHSNASLFKANEIKRAAQGNQAQLGDAKRPACIAGRRGRVAQGTHRACDDECLEVSRGLAGRDVSSVDASKPLRWRRKACLLE